MTGAFYLRDTDPLLPKVVSEPSVDGGFLVNVDGVIAMARDADTEPARVIYRTFRKIYSEMKTERPDEADSSVRAQAMLSTLKKCGFNLVKA